VTDFAFSREPDPVWVERLESVSPRSDRLSYLLLGWLPGSVRPAKYFNGRLVRAAAWIPVERWVFYNVVPDPAKYPPMLFEPFTLSGRRNGVVRPVVDLSRRAMDRNQWAIYRETGRYAQPYFVVQGDRGGHKRNYTEIEAKLSKFHGGTGEPPGLGELPYAEPDERTWTKLEQLDLARFWTHAIALDERKPEHFEADEKEALKDFRRKLWEWMDEKAYSVTSGVADMNAWRAGAAQNPLPVGFKDTRDYEAEEREFIENPA